MPTHVYAQAEEEALRKREAEEAAARKKAEAEAARKKALICMHMRATGMRTHAHAHVHRQRRKL